MKAPKTIRVKITRPESIEYFKAHPEIPFEKVRDFREDGYCWVATVLFEEHYLVGVLCGEEGSWWPMEALKALAVAARTYALSRMISNWDKTYDVDDTSKHYQAYEPSLIKNDVDSKLRLAVEATRDQVITYKDKLADSTLYCNSNGGRTVDPRYKEGWGRYVPYLIEKEDPYTKRSGVEKDSHGVGLSQQGTRYMAADGLLYDSMLGFYYVGTEMAKIVDLKEPVKLLRLGSHCEEVKQLQKGLKDHGYNILVDGIFGEQTEQILKEWQKKNGLEVDGIYGPKSAAKFNVGEWDATKAIQLHLLGLGHTEVEATGQYDEDMEMALLKVFKIDEPEEPSPVPQPVPTPSAPPKTDHFTMIEWYSNRWIGNWKKFTLESDWKCEYGVVAPPEDLWPNLQKLMERLEILRSKVGDRRIYIKCGYRSQDYNDGLFTKSVAYGDGGVAKNSYHIQCMAADITVEGLSPSEVYKIADEVFYDGGCHEYGGFVHVDVRGYHARW